MIIPVRCFTCGMVIGDKYRYYVEQVRKKKLAKKVSGDSIDVDKVLYLTKEFVDKTKTPKDGDGWAIHPLPLLTCEGNGRGGGDFYVNAERKQGNVSLIGTWARNRIGVVSKKSDIPKDYKELVFDLVER